MRGGRRFLYNSLRTEPCSSRVMYHNVINVICNEQDLTTSVVACDIMWLCTSSEGNYGNEDLLDGLETSMFASELSKEVRVENLASGQQGNVAYLIVLPHSSIMSCPSPFEELTSVVNVYINQNVFLTDHKALEYAFQDAFNVHRKMPCNSYAKYANIVKIKSEETHLIVLYNISWICVKTGTNGCHQGDLLSQSD